MRSLLFFVFFLYAVVAIAQPVVYTVANAHAHNDYEKPFPFRQAWNMGFGSIEADIFLTADGLLVAHDSVQLLQKRSLEELYLKPLAACVQQYKGYPYADSLKQLQLMIDIKTAAVPTLDALIALLRKYPLITGSSKVAVVISGGRPDPSMYATYPSWIWFDGELRKEYPAAALNKIAMLSDNFKDYSSWNGKGIIPAAERAQIDAAISKAHRLQKKVRFWGAPDEINAWFQFMHMQVEYINTDKVAELAKFFQQLPVTTYKASQTYTPYQPTYRTDAANKKVKNIIVLIGDGTGLPQWYAGYTANKGALNVFNMRNTGLSKTSSFDSYITDSAPGSTAISSGQKTNNRAVGVDHTGVALPLLPVLMAEQKKKTGIITCGDITDATPADFYAHQQERSSSSAILADLQRSAVDILIGSRNDTAQAPLRALQSKYTIVPAMEQVTDNTDKKWVVIDKQAGLSVLKGRGDWLQRAFDRTTTILSKNKDGFFMMLEGAQVDHGGHANNLPYLVTELMDFDQVIGKALEFADKDGETLVIVTADHETGGLTLLDGDYKAGYVGGQFATTDHTALPVPVFAYGPRSYLFTGVYENTAIFNKILEAVR
ncbi:MAG: alkaline phosphatase [Chitinophagaceae bacterium]